MVKPICTCNTNIENEIYDAITDKEYKSELKTFIVFIFCPSCKQLLQVEINSEDHEILGIYNR